MERHVVVGNMEDDVEILFFFFQAEDGIRDKLVTGVQTCALPICGRRFQVLPERAIPICSREAKRDRIRCGAGSGKRMKSCFRSEERRVGKECRSRWSAYH